MWKRTSTTSAPVKAEIQTSVLERVWFKLTGWQGFWDVAGQSDFTGSCPVTCQQCLGTVGQGWSSGSCFWGMGNSEWRVESCPLEWQRNTGGWTPLGLPATTDSQALGGKKKTQELVRKVPLSVCLAGSFQNHLLTKTNIASASKRSSSITKNQGNRGRFGSDNQ